MRRRCRTHAGRRCYKDYVQRGITVCERWNDFDVFLDDMGPKPSSQHSIERRDNERGYEPDNCTWAVRKAQARNRQSSHIVTWQGRRMTLVEACELADQDYYAVHQRIRALNWTIQRALSFPTPRRFAENYQREDLGT